MPYGWNYQPDNNIHWLLGLVLMLIFWGGLAWVLAMVFRRRPVHHAVTATQAPLRDGPEEILRRRFARGEIDETEFRARRETLREDGSTRGDDLD